MVPWSVRVDDGGHDGGRGQREWGGFVETEVILNDSVQVLEPGGTKI